MNDKCIVIAKQLAFEFHQGQKRKFGKKEDYIHHPWRVANRCKDPVSKCIAWLHDSIEDSNDKNEVIKIIQDKFPQMVFDGIATLTRGVDESYFDYIVRISDSPATVLCVKLADLEDNMSDLDEGSMKDKYRLAHYIIKTQIEKNYKIEDLLNPIKLGDTDGQEGQEERGTES